MKHKIRSLCYSGIGSSPDATDEQKEFLKKRLENKIKEVDLSVEILVEDWDDLHRQRLEGFTSEIDEGDIVTLIEEGKSKNYLPSNLLYKWLERWGYVQLLHKLRGIEKAETEMKPEERIEEVKKVLSNRKGQQIVLDENILKLLDTFAKTPISFWTKDLPAEDSMSIAYLAADEMIDIEPGQDQGMKFLEAVKKVVNKEDFWEQIEEKDPNRKKRLEALDWSLEKIQLSETGVWPRMGRYPKEWCKGSVLDTARHVLEGMDEKEYEKTSKFILSLVPKYITILRYLPPLVVSGGIIRKDPYFNKLEWDLEDGNHRAVAAAIGGATTIYAFVGRAKVSSKRAQELPAAVPEVQVYQITTPLGDDPKLGKYISSHKSGNRRYDIYRNNIGAYTVYNIDDVTNEIDLTIEREEYSLYQEARDKIDEMIRTGQKVELKKQLDQTEVDWVLWAYNPQDREIVWSTYSEAPNHTSLIESRSISPLNHNYWMRGLYSPHRYIVLQDLGIEGQEIRNLDGLVSYLTMQGFGSDDQIMINETLTSLGNARYVFEKGVVV